MVSCPLNWTHFFYLSSCVYMCRTAREDYLGLQHLPKRWKTKLTRNNVFITENYYCHVNIARVWTNAMREHLNGKKTKKNYKIIAIQTGDLCVRFTSLVLVLLFFCIFHHLCLVMIQAMKVL